MTILSLQQGTLLSRYTLSVGSQITVIILGSFLIALSSRISVPMFPVPMTMQSLAVVLVGAALGPKLGTMAVMLYIVEGLVGLPVFAGPPYGPARLAGPTGGYLVAFPFAAFTAGWAMRFRFSHSTIGATLVMLAGHAIILTGGVSWLAFVTGWEKAVAIGLTPFLLGSVVKSALGAATIKAMQRGLASQPGT
jgi:biotin transport system substrate-specific component